GKIRHGKDAAAKVLLDQGWHHASFAAALKDFTYRLNPIIGAGIQGDLLRLAPMVDHLGWEAAKDQWQEVRALLQRCGTDAGRRTLSEDVWVNAAMSALPEGAIVAVTDVRCPNEAGAITMAGGIVVRVVRPVAPNSGNHPSETAMDGYPVDFTVINNGT